jgi:hypothetical protein
MIGDRSISDLPVRLISPDKVPVGENASQLTIRANNDSGSGAAF